MSNRKNITHTRSLAVLICSSVIDDKNSIGEAIDIHLKGKDISVQDRSFIQTLSYGVLRWYWQLNNELNPLLKKPLRNKERFVKYILLVGIFQIQHLKTPFHAAVSDTVKCCQYLGKNWAKNLVNACLRNFIRNYNSELNLQIETHHSHPDWMYEKIINSWPEYSHSVLAANNQAAPLCLRVNQNACTREKYLALLESNNIQAEKDPYSQYGIRIAKSIAVNQLPNFSQGWVSVQDTASQLIAQFLDIRAQQRILDACAAPGGKTSLLLEQAPEKVTMHALEISKKRNSKLQETLERLNLTAKIIIGDARNHEWWDGAPYQRILVDAPCSGSGIIRRHPDIKHLRKPDHLEELHRSQ